MCYSSQTQTFSPTKHPLSWPGLQLLTSLSTSSIRRLGLYGNSREICTFSCIINPFRATAIRSGFLADRFSNTTKHFWKTEERKKTCHSPMAWKQDVPWPRWFRSITKWRESRMCHGTEANYSRPSTTTSWIQISQLYNDLTVNTWELQLHLHSRGPQNFSPRAQLTVQKGENLQPCEHKCLPTSARDQWHYKIWHQ